jgi:hypothetical protein
MFAIGNNQLAFCRAKKFVNTQKREPELLHLFCNRVTKKDFLLLQIELL